MPRRDKNKVVKEAPKSSKGIKVELVERQLDTYTTAEQIAEFTKGDLRPTILKVVEEAMVKLIPPKVEKPPEVKPTVEKPPEEKPPEEKLTMDEDGKGWKLLRKAHRGPAYLEDGKMVRGPKYVKGDVVKPPEGTSESEIKRLFGNKELWEEL